MRVSFISESFPLDIWKNISTLIHIPVHTSSLSKMLSPFASPRPPALLGSNVIHSVSRLVILTNRVRFGLTEHPTSHVKNGSLPSSLKYSKMLSVVVFLVLCDPSCPHPSPQLHNSLWSPSGVLANVTEVILIPKPPSSFSFHLFCGRLGVEYSI